MVARNKRDGVRQRARHYGCMCSPVCFGGNSYRAYAPTWVIQSRIWMPMRSMSRGPRFATVHDDVARPLHGVEDASGPISAREERLERLPIRIDDVQQILALSVVERRVASLGVESMLRLVLLPGLCPIADLSLDAAPPLLTSCFEHCA